MTDETPTILFKFADEGGRMRKVANTDLDEQELAQLSGKSREAVEKILNTIGWVAGQARELINKVHGDPDEVSLEFGVKINTKAGVIVMQADGEFHIKATVTCKKKG